MTQFHVLSHLFVIN